MTDVERIVNALQLAIQDSSSLVYGNRISMFSKPDMLTVVDGDQLKSAVQAIINIYGVHANEVVPRADI